MVEGTYGYIINVPEGNGYSRDSFQARVIPHLESLTRGSFHLPGNLEMYSRRGDQRTEIPSDERNFGATVDLNGAWWADLFHKRDLAASVMTHHYGLVVTGATVRYGNHGLKVILTHEIEESEEFRSV